MSVVCVRNPARKSAEQLARHLKTKKRSPDARRGAARKRRTSAVPSVGQLMTRTTEPSARNGAQRRIGVQGSAAIKKIIPRDASASVVACEVASTSATRNANAFKTRMREESANAAARSTESANGSARLRHHPQKNV